MEECHHIRVNGTKCGSVALRGELWCYYHHALFPEAAHRRRLAIGWDKTRELYGEDSPTRLYGENQLDLPHIEDISSIQLAIARVIAALAANAIDNKRARLLLHGLQIAARILPRVALTVRDTVSEVGQTPDGVDMATAKPIGEEQPETLGMLLMREVKRRAAQDEAEKEQAYADNEAFNVADDKGRHAITHARPLDNALHIEASADLPKPKPRFSRPVPARSAVLPGNKSTRETIQPSEIHDVCAQSAMQHPVPGPAPGPAPWS